MTIEDALSAGTSRAAQVLRTVTSTIRHRPALMRQARVLYRASRRPLYREPAMMDWVDRYLRFYDSKPLYRLDASHAAAFLAFCTTTHTCTEAEEALRFFHERVLCRPLPATLKYRPRPEHADAVEAPSDRTAARSLWSEDAPEDA